MNFIYNFFYEKPIEATEAREIAVKQSAINQSLTQNLTLQHCMRDIKSSSNHGYTHTYSPTQNDDTINSLLDLGYQVEKTKYSEDDYNYGFSETITRHGIKISWNDPE